MKNIFTAFLLVTFSAQLIAQCSIEPFSLEKRISMSDIVVEAKVIHSEPRWSSDRGFIYTVNQLQVFKSFNGKTVPAFIDVITEGGRIGFEMVTAHPTLEITKGQTGVFLLAKSNLQLFGETSVNNRYTGVASVQSVITYDWETHRAYDYVNIYESITASLYPALEQLTGKKLIETDKNPDPWAGKIRPLATPVITGFSSDTVTSGTGMLLTISGTNFGFSPGTGGGVGFVDANFGDGRFFYPEFASSYKSWSNTQIEVYVPSRAGTGKVRVTNSSLENGTSSGSIYVKYSHLNATYGSATVDTQYYVTDHVDDNTKGGYTWQMNTKFKAKANPVNAFMRSLENWRCATLVNWDVGNETTTDAITRDNVNLVRLTRFGDSRLGVCYSYWSGCGSGSNLLWYVAELDIEFDSTKNWYYGTVKPGGSQIDFESVSTHELGHGHQMGHVIDSKKIMHYSIANGERKTVLNSEDLEGALAVMNRSTQNNFCGPAKMVAINQNKCSITKPRASFTLSKTLTACPGDVITVTDSTEGLVDSYQWFFGDANIATANTKGPHSISYTTAGTKVIVLVVTNAFGSDTSGIELVIKPAAPALPQFLSHTDSVCAGQQKYYINAGAGAESYLWTLTGGGSVVGPNTDTVLTVNWVIAGGPYKVRTVAINTCGNSGTSEIEVSVFTKAAATFGKSLAGRTVDFTNTSTNADTYKWYFGDGDSSDLKNPSHTYPFASNYTVQLIASNFCSSSTTTQDVVTVNGVWVNDLTMKGIVTYPNPVQDNWYIINKNTGNLEVILTDIAGKQTAVVSVPAGQSGKVNLGTFAPGVYFATFLLNEQYAGVLRLVRE